MFLEKIDMNENIGDSFFILNNVNNKIMNFNM